MKDFSGLMKFQRETEALANIYSRLSWDQEAMMPSGAAPQRAEEMAALAEVLHSRRSHPDIGDLLETIKPECEESAAHLREIRRGYEQATKVPPDLVKAVAGHASAAQRIWAQAREDENVADFLPVLDKMVRLKREEGAALAEGGDIYDALLDQYEPGASGTETAAILDAMRPPLVDLRRAVLERPQPAGLSGKFDTDRQLALAIRLAKTFGYNFDHGRLDCVVHPFCAGGGLDVRITTRTVADDPCNCIYSTIHETGHACYELGVDRSYLLTPLGGGASMGIHESQSRMYENQLGRSRPFTGWLYGQMVDSFGDFGIDGPDAFHKAMNRIGRGYIRTEADELQYNLHIMLRFDLERALMSGDLQVRELESAWNDRFAADFGYSMDRPSNGMLQDVHWSLGLFGYFPTYSLGNIYAGCLYAALRRDVPDLDVELAQGELSGATAWLGDRIHRFGKLYAPRELIVRATGADPSEAPFLDYLQVKFGDIYAL